MATTFLVPKNNATSALASGISDVDTSLTVVTGEGVRFPSTFPFHVSIGDEIIRVGARSGDVLSSLTRAQEGTTAAAHSSASVVNLQVTAQAISDLNDAVNDLENAGYQPESEKDTANGYPGIDVNSRLVIARLPLADADGKLLVRRSGAMAYDVLADADIPAAIARDAEVTSALSTHEGAADPHPPYQKESEKGTASGYASLDAGTKVPTAELGGAGADATKFLRGDQSWQVPAGGSLLVLNKSADQSNSTTTAADITDLTVAIAASQVLHFRAYLVMDASASTTGIRVAINGPAIGAGRITVTFVEWTGLNAFTTTGVNAYETYRANTASSGTSSRIFEIHGIIANGANAGTFALRFRSEVDASSVFCRKGSWMQYFLT